MNSIGPLVQVEMAWMTDKQSVGSVPAGGDVGVVVSFSSALVSLPCSGEAGEEGRSRGGSRRGGLDVCSLVHLLPTLIRPALAPPQAPASSPHPSLTPYLVRGLK